MNNEARPAPAVQAIGEEVPGLFGMTLDALADAMRVLAPDIEALVNDESSITPEMAERLATHFGGDAGSWLELQAEYDRKTRASSASTESSAPEDKPPSA